MHKRENALNVIKMILVLRLSLVELQILYSIPHRIDGMYLLYFPMRCSILVEHRKKFIYSRVYAANTVIAEHTVVNFTSPLPHCERANVYDISFGLRAKQRPKCRNALHEEIWINNLTSDRWNETSLRERNKLIDGEISFEFSLFFSVTLEVAM